MFFVQEIQTNGNVGTALPIKTAPTREEAMSIFHGILQYAAISKVEYHAAMVYDHTGQVLLSECYQHPLEKTDIEHED